MNEDYPQRFAQALGLALGDDEVKTLLDLAREVAHGSERRFAPLSTYLAGRYVARRVDAGASPSEALGEAVAIAREALRAGPPSQV